MWNLTRYRWLIFCAFCVVFVPISSGLLLQSTVAFPLVLATSSPIPERDISIVVLAEMQDGLFEIGEIFTQREREGFQIWTHQSHFWQPGDEGATGQQVTIIFDEHHSIKPFYFWRSPLRRDVIDQITGERLGSYMATDMLISVSTAQLELGRHIMAIQVENSSGAIFTQSWEFEIQQRTIPRQPLPKELAPTAEYLQSNPFPTPEFIVRVDEVAGSLPDFSSLESGEGICLLITDAPFLTDEAFNNPFRANAWGNIDIQVDAIALSAEQVSIARTDAPGNTHICFDTDYLRAGVHLATIVITVDSFDYPYTWAFIIE